MHDTALLLGRRCLELYWQPHFVQLLDVGSYDVNGSLRAFLPDGGNYLGIDLMPGPGVDIVLEKSGSFPLRNDFADMVISTSCFEHDPAFWVTFAEMARIVRPGGLIYTNVPSNHGVHRFPRDYWRFYPDAGHALAAWSARAGNAVELVESFVADPVLEGWADFVAVFRKPDGKPLQRKGKLGDCLKARHRYDVDFSEQPVRVRWQTHDMQVIARQAKEIARLRHLLCKNWLTRIALVLLRMSGR